MREISPELEARIYQSVLRAVLWDEKREEIFHMLKVNGIEGADAEAMYGRARGERIAQIRGGAVRKILRGLGLFATGACTGWFYWVEVGAITKYIAITCGVSILMGAWWILDGSLCAALAAKQTGSLFADEED